MQHFYSKNIERGINVENSNKYDVLEEKIKYVFKNKILLKQALTHSSWANESKNIGINNERLEFLGDSVLSIVISEYLYKKRRDLEEGYLSKYRSEIVCEPSLARCAREIGLGKYLLMGKGEEMTGGRDRESILADAMEALIAAIYLDSDLNTVSKIVLDLFDEIIKEVLSGLIYRDYKTKLQEVSQKMGIGKINYMIIDEYGPDHNKVFVIEVYVGKNLLGKGCGKSKKEAEQFAAMEALSKMGIIK
ncbi:ribonuclease III [Thermoanaerobacterium sp. RBIITD]|uniref:ribonuclease III n=1 Tax=Thermoanaerobacterium sp. RBIITD TaxID=1550240 RepID=UPI000BC0D0B5|nr:ribonuclease III [Thermoanaerobacterium sp. RBIITD]SNX55561.1 ribonuclease-3 [Thermoanaerobacterium sp. RBIITD]